MTTFKRKKALANIPKISVGDVVSLVGDVKYHGTVDAYLGYELTPKVKGRTYRISWVYPTKRLSVHFDFELVRIKGKLKLKTRPKKGN